MAKQVDHTIFVLGIIFMRAFYSLITFCFLAINVYAQIDTTHKVILENLVRRAEPKGTVYYCQNVSEDVINKVIRSLKKRKIFGLTRDTKNNFIILTKKEKTGLINSLKNSITSNWKDSLFANSKRIPSDSLEAQISVNAKKFEQFANNIANIDSFRRIKGDDYYQYYMVFIFSDVFFIRNNSIFLNYLMWFCGGECGLEEYSFIKKKTAIGKDGSIWVGECGNK